MILAAIGADEKQERCWDNYLDSDWESYGSCDNGHVPHALRQVTRSDGLQK